LNRPFGLERKIALRSGSHMRFSLPQRRPQLAVVLDREEAPTQPPIYDLYCS